MIPRKPRLADSCASSGSAAVGGDVHRLDLVGGGDKGNRLAGWQPGAPIENADPERGDAQDLAAGAGWSFECPQRDVDLAARQPIDDEEAADLAGLQQRERPIRLSDDFDGIRSLPLRIRDTARRHVEQGVGDGDGSLRELGIRRHDGDPRDGLPIQIPERDRRDRDHHRQDREKHGRGQEERAPRPVAIFAPGDDPGVRQERVAAGHQVTPLVDSDPVATSGTSVEPSSAG